MLVWDNFRAHKTARVKVCADEVCNTDLVLVLPGCTSLLQALIYAGISHSSSDTELWDEWPRQWFGNLQHSSRQSVPTYQARVRIVDEDSMGFHVKGNNPLILQMCRFNHCC